MLPACTKVLPACTQMLSADFILTDFPHDFVYAGHVVELLPACTKVLPAEKKLCTTEVLSEEVLSVEMLPNEMLQCRPLRDCRVDLQIADGLLCQRSSESARQARRQVRLPV